VLSKSRQILEITINVLQMVGFDADLAKYSATSWRPIGDEGSKLHTTASAIEAA
jgi:hypothetical protein